MPALSSASLSDTDLLAYTQQGDALADAAVADLPRLRPYRLLEAVEDAARGGHRGAEAFLDHTWSVPRWVDFDRVELGARVSRTLGLGHLVVLIFGSLLEGYASHSLAAPLVASGRLRQDAAKRLFETGHVFHNGRQPGGLRPGAVGHRSILAVRLLHGAVRKHLARVNYVSPDGGVAIHQLDMAHTASSVTHVGQRGLDRLGFRLPPHEQEALQHFQRLVHTWHGVAEPLLPCSVKEEAVFNARLAKLRYDAHNPAAKPLVHAALTAMTHRAPFYLSAPALAAISRRLLGDSFADTWEIGGTGSWRHAVTALRTITTTASFAFRHTGSLLGPPVRWAQESLYIRTLADALDLPDKRAFGPIADRRFGRARVV